MTETEATLDTKLGEMYVRANGRDCITLMMQPTVRGILYNVSLYADKNNYKDQWFINHNFTRINRNVMTYPDKGVSEATRSLIINTCQTALNTWLETHANMCEETQVARLTREAQATREAVYAMREALKAKEQLLASQIEELGKLPLT